MIAVYTQIQEYQIILMTVHEISQIMHADKIYAAAKRKNSIAKILPNDWQEEIADITLAVEEFSKYWPNKPFDNNNGILEQGAITLFYYFLLQLTK